MPINNSNNNKKDTNHNDVENHNFNNNDDAINEHINDLNQKNKKDIVSAKNSIKIKKIKIAKNINRNNKINNKKLWNKY